MNDPRGLPSSGGFVATFSREREKGLCGRSERAETLMEARGAPPLPLAGEGWGEGKPHDLISQLNLGWNVLSMTVTVFACVTSPPDSRPPAFSG
jgi:hypothetical protein